MLAAILFILAANIQGDTSTSDPIPQAEDIRSALIQRWARVSSSGYILHDYAIRNVICKAIPLASEFKQTQKDNDPFHIADPARSQVICSYDYARLPIKTKRIGSPSPFKKMPKPLTEKQLRRIKESQWTREERQFVRFARKVCMMMSRTPQGDECDDYWAAVI